MSALYDFTYAPSDDDEADDLDMLAALIDAYTSEGALARALGVAHSTIYRWRLGTTPRPDAWSRVEQFYAHLTAWETAV